MIVFDMKITADGRSLMAKGETVAFMNLAMPESDAEFLACEIADRFNSHEPDGEVAQLRAEVERLRGVVRAAYIEGRDNESANPTTSDNDGWQSSNARAALCKGAA